MPHRSIQSVTHEARSIRRRIGVNMHCIRVGRRMPLHKLARLSGVPPHIIDQIELGKGEADLHTILRLCAALRVDFMSMIAAD